MMFVKSLAQFLTQVLKKKINVDYFQELGKWDGHGTITGGPKDASNSHQLH